MTDTDVNDGSIERADLDGQNWTMIVPPGGTFTPNAIQTSDIVLPERSGSIIILYLFSLDTPNAIQTSDIVLPERSGSIIILYLFSIISTCYYTPRRECQLC